MSPKPDPTPVPGCAAPGCERAAVAKGLCMRHYKRQWQGKPLVDDRPAVGSPSGFGRYGIFEDAGDVALCHECGRWVAGVGTHAVGAHGLRAAEYRERHGLPRGLGLVSTAVREAMSARSRARVGEAGWKAFEEARDPVAAARARDAEAYSAAARHREPEAQLAGTRAGRRPRVVACTVCGATWCPLPGGYTKKRCSPACSSAHAAAVGREVQARRRG